MSAQKQNSKPKEKKMKEMIFTCSMTFSLVLLLAFSSQAQEGSLLDSVVKGCEQELTTYCKDVTAGEAAGLE